VEEILHQFIGGVSMFIPLFLGFLSSTECQITTWEQKNHFIIISFYIDVKCGYIYIMSTPD
jgi:hypothetical protein